MTASDRVVEAIATRARPISLILLVAYAATCIMIWATSNGGADANGNPLGSDFSSYWNAGELAAGGAPASAYDFETLHSAQRAAFGDGTPFYPFPYPPTFLAIAALLSFLPYLGALLIWQAATLPIYVAALGAAYGSLRRDVVLLGVAFPAVFVNLIHGQNGFLSAGLLGLGVALVDRRPILSGVLIGLLSYKPQFGVLLPVVLIATGRWRTFATAAATTVVICAASLAIFGVDAWTAFLASASVTRTLILEQGGAGWQKFITTFAALRAWGLGVELSYAAQAALAVLVMAISVRLWRSQAAFEVKAAGLISGTMLIAPYALDYDLVTLGPALAFLGADLMRNGWRRLDALTLTCIWLAPFVTRPIAEYTLVPLGLASVVALFVYSAARGGALRVPAIGRQAA